MIGYANGMPVCAAAARGLLIAVGAVGAAVTNSISSALVTLPARFETTQRTSVRWSVTAGDWKVYVASVALGMSAILALNGPFCHWYVIGVSLQAFTA